MASKGSKNRSRQRIRINLLKALKCVERIFFNQTLYLLYYTQACNEFAGPISALLRPEKAAPFIEMSQRRRAVGNGVSDLTTLKIERHTSRSRDERVTARTTGRLLIVPIFSIRLEKHSFLIILTRI